ncbi:MAG TPA: hypothetical protein PKH51_07255, partial [Candidatus Sumerlaeota bacterium]|nr:hypothetical protein [Candidatus Sumerlaeota bacterium]
MLSPRKSLTLALMLSFCSVLPAEKITLTSGDIVEGQIIEQNDRTVTVKTINQTLALPRSRVKSIEAGVPGSNFILQANDALKRNDYRAARDFINQAKEAGARPQDTDPITQLLDKRQAEIELA